MIEIDLRQPSMLHGKKGFERIVWAFKNVLSHSVAWLFYDLESAASEIAEGFCYFFQFAGDAFNSNINQQRISRLTIINRKLLIATQSGLPTRMYSLLPSKG